MYVFIMYVWWLSAPWIKDVWFFGTSYLIPNVDCVVLGGMHCTTLHCVLHCNALRIYCKVVMTS